MKESILGQPLIINASLWDRSQVKYIKAYVYDSSMAQVAGSPFNLSHISNGIYTNSSFTPTSEGLYFIYADVYDDDLYTEFSKDHNRGEETVIVTDREAKIDTIVSDIEITKNAINDNIDGNEGQIT